VPTVVDTYGFLRTTLPRGAIAVVLVVAVVIVVLVRAAGPSPPLDAVCTDGDVIACSASRPSNGKMAITNCSVTVRVAVQVA
jgi:hypothetical protein